VGLHCFTVKFGYIENINRGIQGRGNNSPLKVQSNTDGVPQGDNVNADNSRFVSAMSRADLMSEESWVRVFGPEGLDGLSLGMMFPVYLLDLGLLKAVFRT
jgi:hypothetical protein